MVLLLQTKITYRTNCSPTKTFNGISILIYDPESVPENEKKYHGKKFQAKTGQKLKAGRYKYPIFLH